MAISTDYSTPVIVNGFRCKNCTDVDYAKKHIDPAHPKSGPYGIDAKDDPTVRQTDTQAAAAPSVTAVARPVAGLGAQLDVSA